jgi:hypothetical protein
MEHACRARSQRSMISAGTPCCKRLSAPIPRDARNRGQGRSSTTAFVSGTARSRDFGSSPARIVQFQPGLNAPRFDAARKRERAHPLAVRPGVHWTGTGEPLIPPTGWRAGPGTRQTHVGAGPLATPKRHDKSYHPHPARQDGIYFAWGCFAKKPKSPPPGVLSGALPCCSANGREPAGFARRRRQGVDPDLDCGAGMQ